MNRLGLSILILVLLALGVAACSGDGGSTELEPTIAADTPESTAEPTATAEPQPTPSPPQGTPPAIDTSAWLTYDSPYGFSFDYPPDWTLEVGRAPTCCVPAYIDPGVSTFLMNPVFYEARQEALEASGFRPGEFLPPARAVKIDIIVQSRRWNVPFDAEVYVTQCENAGIPFDPANIPTPVAEQVIADGRTVIVCHATDYSQATPVAWTPRWIELASDHPLLISPGMIQPSAAETIVVDAVLASFIFSNDPETVAP